MAVEKLEIETYFGKCKCCLTYGYLRTMWEKHFVDGEIEIYGQMLTKCFSIAWTMQGTEQEDQICEECIWKLREACTFKKKVLEIQKALGHTGYEADGVVPLKNDDPVIKSEADDESYDVEYLEEEFLENHNDNGGSDEESGDDKESIYERDNQDEGESQDEDDDDDDVDEVIFKDEDIYVEEISHDEVSDEENSAPDSPAPRKRKAKEEKSDSETDTPKPKWPKKLPKEERWKTYKQYTEDDLRQALEDVMDKKMNQKQAATHYHVPRKTLSAKILAIKNDESSVRPLTPTSEVDDPQDNSQDNEDAMLIIKKHRDNIRSVLAYSNATPIRGYWGEGYVCAFCPQQFPEASALQTHTRSHGNISKLYKVHHVRNHVVRLDVTGLKCNICDHKIKDLQSLMHHLKQHKKPMHFDIKNHMIPFKFDAEELECNECSKNFNHFKSLSEHMANVHYRNFVCTRCERGFVNKVNLVAHKDTHKTGKFWCNFCGNLYDTRRKKTTHERLKHSLQTKSVKCGYCKMRFQSINQKNNHELRAHMKQQTAYSCNSCEKSYARQRSLRDHINKDHLLQRPYKCPQKPCKKAFYLKKTLQAHILTHGDAKPFPCAECSKEYRSEKALKEHMYTHNDRKEFKCNKCSKSYVHEDNLKRHLKEKH